MTTPDQTPEDGAGRDARARPPGGLTAAMKYTLYAVLVVVVVGAVVSVALVFSSRNDPVAAPTTTSATPTSGPSPGSTPTSGSEVQSPDPTQSGSGRIPPLVSPTPLVTPPLPAAASAEGRLVDGFPSEVVAPIAGSDIVNSAVASEGDALQVTLVARTDASPADVKAGYREAWGALGLSEAPPAEGSSDLLFSNDYATLTLGSTSTGTGTVYMISGVLRAS